MNLLSKVSYYKINLLATRVEIRSTLNVLGLCSNKRADKKNKEDFYKVVELMKNLNKKDKKKINRYIAKHND